MAEADAVNNNDALLSGLDSGDLTSGTYEGGFKTWECAVDLASYVATNVVPTLSRDQDWQVIELGAGSAIPSCRLLQKYAVRRKSKDTQRVHFSLCDFNEDVLKLCTAANVLLNTPTIVGPLPEPAEGNEEELDFEQIDLEEVLRDLQRYGVTVDLLSGSWGEDLAKLVLSRGETLSKPPDILILASETIYSPDSLPDFSTTLVELLKNASPSSKALIAAKQIYFGVGGGVEEFITDIKKRGAEVKQVSEVSTGGVGRVILEVTMGDEDG
jgi:protein-histidine N-methyltransferase